MYFHGFVVIVRIYTVMAVFRIFIQIRNKSARFPVNAKD